jgi:moderate conductance mechanosensitive channel
VIQGRVITILGVIVVFAAAAIVVRLARIFIARFVGKLDHLSAESRAAIQKRAATLGRAFALLAYGIAAIVSVSLGVERLGLAEPRWDPQAVSRWFLTHGVNLVVIVVGAVIVNRVAGVSIEHLQHRLHSRQGPLDFEWQRRASTIGGLLQRMVGVSLSFVAILMVLRELSIDVLPVLTGAGIAGLAVGFGAQNLVRDIISGFFLILEDQVRVGDQARINGVMGTVEDVRLRTIVLRDGDGAVQVFPNGSITSLANFSKQFAFATVDVRVPYTQNTTAVMDAIRDVGRDMQSDPEWNSLVLDAINVLGVESLEGGTTLIRAKFKTRPLKQGSVANELRRRVLTAFEKRGIPLAGAPPLPPPTLPYP